MSKDYTMDWLNYCRICDALRDLNGGFSTGSVDKISEEFFSAESQKEEIERILKPTNRQGKEFSWKEAVGSIAMQLKNVHPSIGLYLSSEIGRSSADLLQSLAFGVSYGTKYIFSDQGLH